MIMQEGQTRVTADPRKGKITVKRGEDDLMHFIWTDREQGRQEDDLIIFPGDATFGYVEQARNNKTNNRVYALKFTSTPKKVHFYWMQEVASAAEKDKELAEKVNSMINGDTQSSASGGIGQLDQAQLMAMLTQAHSTAASATAGTAPAAPAPASGESSSTGDGAAPAAAEAPAQAQAAAEAGTDATPAAEGGTAEDADGDKMKVDDEEKQ